MCCEMNKQRVGLLTQMRSKLTLDEEELLNRNSREEEERVNKGEEGPKSESKAEQLPEGNPPKTLETLLLSDAW